MPRFHLARRLLMLLGLLLCLSGGVLAPAVRAQQAEEEPPATEAEEDPDLPKLETMVWPSVERLLKGPPVDWLVLAGDRVLEVEPVSPRPDTLAKLEADAFQKQKLAEYRDLPSDDEAKKAKKRQLRLALLDFEITLPEVEDARPYKLPRNLIRSIIHHEDMLLHRIDQLLDDGRHEETLDLFVAFELRAPDWPGLAARQERFLHIDATQKLQAGSGAEALALFEELHRRNPEYKDLAVDFNKSGDLLISAAIQAQDYRQARYYLDRIRTRFPDVGAVRRGTEQLTTLAAERVAAAVAAEQAGELARAVDEVTRATRIWPAGDELPAVHRRIFAKYPRLVVGVTDVPRSNPGLGFPNAADRRAAALEQVALFEPVRYDGKSVRYASPLFASWEPTDLGGSLLFQLHAGRSLTPATADQLIAGLRARLDPASPQYDERLASATAGIIYQSPWAFSINFRRGPLRPEALFTFPAAGAAAAPDSAESHTGPASIPRYALQTADETRRVYRRRFEPVVAIRELPIEELVEVQYPSGEEAVRGLLRGEVVLLPDVRPWEAAALARHPDFVVIRGGLPATYVLQFHPRHKALSKLMLRRALAFAIDRQAILDEVLLRHTPGDRGRLTSAPYPIRSYAYDGAVKPHAYDIRLALSLLLAAKKELGGDVPPLRLACSFDPDQRAAAERIAQAWRRIGLTVSLQDLDALPLHDPAAADWDVVYRPVRLPEPLTDLWPCLTLSAQARIEDLRPWPSWLRQEVIALDRAGDRATVERQLKALQRHLWAEVTLIPLWELDDFHVARKALTNLTPQPFHVYQGVEHWRLQPWFAKDVQ